MKYQYALNAAGIIFLVVAILHLLRIIFKVHVVMGTWGIPLWVSGVGFLIALVLSGWMFFCSKN